MNFLQVVLPNLAENVRTASVDLSLPLFDPPQPNTVVPVVVLDPSTTWLQQLFS